MDRHRLRQRIDALNENAKSADDLAKVPDRILPTDLSNAAALMRGAALDMRELMEAKLPGCVCRRIDHDDYSYLVYSIDCRHHHQLHVLMEKLKTDYAKMEKALKDEARMKLVATALTGTTSLAMQDLSVFSRNAIAIADETIARLTETP